MRPRLKASLLWGAVGALSFLVLAQAYTLLAGGSVPFLAKLGVAVFVGIGATGTTYVADGWLAERKRRV